MPISLTPEQIQELLSVYASGITEVEVPGDKRIRYADPRTLGRILADALAVQDAPLEGSGTRTYAEFHRNR